APVHALPFPLGRVGEPYLVEPQHGGVLDWPGHGHLHGRVVIPPGRPHGEPDPIQLAVAAHLAGGAVRRPVPLAALGNQRGARAEPHGLTTRAGQEVPHDRARKWNGPGHADLEPGVLRGTDLRHAAIMPPGYDRTGRPAGRMPGARGCGYLRCGIPTSWRG